MRVTIDAVGRLVIPKQLRERVGMLPGEVEVTIEGAGLHLEVVASEDLAEENGRLVIPSSGAASGAMLDDALVRAMRDAGQR